MPEKSSLYCQQCGNPIRDENRFCTYCGMDITQESENPASPPTDSKSSESANLSFEHSKSDRILSWLKHLPFFYQVALLGLISFVLIILLSPVTYMVGQIVVLISVIALALKLYRSDPWRSWGLVLLSAISLTLLIGLASNIVYNTAFLGGIMHELSAEESRYIESVVHNQDRILEAESNYRALNPRSPDISEDEALQAGGALLGRV